MQLILKFCLFPKQEKRVLTHKVQVKKQKESLNIYENPISYMHTTRCIRHDSFFKKWFMLNKLAAFFKA